MPADISAKGLSRLSPENHASAFSGLSRMNSIIYNADKRTQGEFISGRQYFTFSQEPEEEKP